MRITRVYIENYRSIEKLELTDLGPFVVLYGPNGGGKSNILRAIATAVRSLSLGWGGERPPASELRAGATEGRLELSIEFHEPERVGSVAVRALRLVAALRAPTTSITFVPCSLPEMTLSSPHSTVPEGWTDGMFNDFIGGVSGWLQGLGGRFTRLDDVRSFTHARHGVETRAAGHVSVLDLLAAGRVEEAVARAATSDDDGLRAAYTRLKAILMAPPLGLPELDAVVPNGEYRLRVRTPDGKRTLPASVASLGEQQVISVLGAVLFSGARAVALEEPEAHLHAPTTGRALREVLRSLVTSGDLDQLFIATHSNLFDLDESGFLHVRRGDGGATVATPEPLVRIDQDHLFEPGPAKRALQEVLRLESPSKTVARVDGRELTASEMLAELQSDSEVGVRYASDLSRAAARSFVRKPIVLGS